MHSVHKHGYTLNPAMFTGTMAECLTFVEEKCYGMHSLYRILKTA